MSWVGELRRAFVRLQAGDRPRLVLDGKDATVEAIGTEFNALVDDLEKMKVTGASREDLHRARNRLAGILAALHLKAEIGEALGAGDSASLEAVIEEARKLDGRLQQS